MPWSGLVLPCTSTRHTRTPHPCQQVPRPTVQVLQGAQLIAVASSDPAATGVDGSPLQGSDIQVQYVQLAPVTDHTAAAQPLVGRAVPRWAAVLFLRCSRLALSREPQKSSAWAPSGQFLSCQVGVGAAARDVRSVRPFGPSECAWLGDHCGLPWAADALQPTLQSEMQLEHGAIQIQ
ncbi:hypothetical protein J1605_006888 [Eschrichtius robustus]|uniref:Uncharacterized protein n=1 Tax=Eschrichtius robustus TaxID=9764 RepID=A0AB34H0T5_ESCRO|nr:hypothetical protein J1605_006888 [Eschrichtius robustus]